MTLKRWDFGIRDILSGNLCFLLIQTGALVDAPPPHPPRVM